MGHYAGEMGYVHEPDAYERAGFIKLSTPGQWACKTCRVVFYFPEVDFAQEHQADHS